MQKSEYLTEAQIIEDLYEELTYEDVQALRNMYKTEDSLGVLHHGYGTYIRNTYKLWDAENPLTHQWFKDCAEATDGHHHHMKDGVDYHPQHPDQVSFEIIKQVWRKAVAV